jgi:hypothetical protein
MASTRLATASTTAERAGLSYPQERDGILTEKIGRIDVSFRQRRMRGLAYIATVGDFEGKRDIPGTSLAINGPRGMRSWQR